MAAKAKVNAVLKAMREIQAALPVGGIEQLLEELQSEILDSIEENLEALAEKDRLTEKQEQRQGSLENELCEWEGIRDDLEEFKDAFDELESIIERIESLD